MLWIAASSLIAAMIAGTTWSSRRSRTAFIVARRCGHSWDSSPASGWRRELETRRWRAPLLPLAGIVSAALPAWSSRRRQNRHYRGDDGIDGVSSAAENIGFSSGKTTTIPSPRHRLSPFRRRWPPAPGNGQHSCLGRMAVTIDVKSRPRASSRTFCSTQSHEYELYLAVEDIDHSRTKTKSPQTNGICELFPSHCLG